MIFIQQVKGKEINMEIKATLQKPYTKQDRLDFIYIQNRRKHYEIRETNLALEAWGLTAEEQEEKRKQQRNQEIDDKIRELNEMAIPDILEGNTENIKLYNEVIAGLEAAKV